jgi:hypothetical protein
MKTPCTFPMNGPYYKLFTTEEVKRLIRDAHDIDRKQPASRLRPNAPPIVISANRSMSLSAKCI